MRIVRSGYAEICLIGVQKMCRQYAQRGGRQEGVMGEVEWGGVKLTESNAKMSLAYSHPPSQNISNNADCKAIRYTISFYVVEYVSCISKRLQACKGNQKNPKAPKNGAGRHQKKGDGTERVLSPSFLRRRAPFLGASGSL